MHGKVSSRYFIIWRHGEVDNYRDVTKPGIHFEHYWQFPHVALQCLPTFLCMQRPCLEGISISVHFLTVPIESVNSKFGLSMQHPEPHVIIQLRDTAGILENVLNCCLSFPLTEFFKELKYAQSLVLSLPR